MIKKILIGMTGALALTTTACVAQSSLEKELNEVDVTVNEEKAVPIEVVKKTWTCPTCTPNEQLVLQKLQEHTRITDRNALATIMGNIKSESNFVPNICEGGARVNYEHCHSGGFGLIQWTTHSRYDGLGAFAKKYECNPSEMVCQIRYMINENQFQKVLPEFEGGGQTVRQYMVPSYYWLGWGIKGYREHYAYDYTKKMVFA